MPQIDDPVLLIPGLLCDAALWRRQLHDIGEERQVRVMDITTAASISQLAAMILSAAPPRFALAGLSMGGYVALEMCRIAPNRIARLALLDTNAHDDPPEAQARRQNQIARAKDDFAAVVDELLGVLVAPASAQKPAIAQTWRAMAWRLGAAVFARQQTAIMRRRDQRDLLERLAMPALVLCGALDGVTPPARHEEMAGLLPDAELVIVPDAGHLAPLETPQAVSEAMRRWLRR